LSSTRFRVYPDGEVVHEDEFHLEPEDASGDYKEYNLPDTLINFICEDASCARLIDTHLGKGWTCNLASLLDKRN